MRPSLRWIVACAMLVVPVVVIPSAGTSVYAAPAVPEDDPVDPVEGWLSKVYGVTPEEAAVRAALQEDFEKISVELGTQYASSWAGSWIDHENSGRLVIQFAGAIPDFPADIITVPADRFELCVVDFTNSDLEKIKDSLNVTLEGPGTASAMVMVKYDVNRVVVELYAPKDQLPAAFLLSLLDLEALDPSPIAVQLYTGEDVSGGPL